MLSNQKYRISNLAKDFDLKSKEVVDLLNYYGFSGKTHMAVLEPDEFAILFDHLTTQKQAKAIDGYINGEARIKGYEPKKAEETKAEEEKPDEAKAPEVSEAPKAEEKKPDEAKAPEVSEAPKAEEKKPDGAKAPELGKEQKPEEKKPGIKNDAVPAKDRKPPVRTEFRAGPITDRRPSDDRFRRNDRQSDDRRTQTQGKPRFGDKKTVTPVSNDTGVKVGTPALAQKQAAKNNASSAPAVKPKKEQKKQPAQQRQHRQELKVQTTIADTPEHTRQSSNVANTRVIDTRSSHVDLSKYDERLENFVSDSKMNYAGERQKLKKQNSRPAGKEKDKEKLALEKLKRAEFERAKKLQLQITVPDEITVGELASRMKVTAGETIKRLMKLGIMANVNQIIDYDTAFLVADELGVKVTKEVVVTIEEKLFEEKEDSEENLQKRAPVVVVMGHVDHGKTSLLDAIRNTHVTAGEAGGITQHIGAYRVKANGQDITFLDTPGHEAFTAMRARGAMATDIAILVVAADDGIMPQTIEAINHAKAAKVEVIVAINKMDKPGANPDAIKQNLTKYDLVPEEWGGDVICVPVSALTGQGIGDLLDNVLLVAEVKDLKANPDRRAKGIVIESKLDKGKGPVATVLVQNGTLRNGDVVIAGTSVGRVRAMTDDTGRSVKTAGPSVPVEIIGLAEVPESGDEFNAVEDERMARELAEQRRSKQKEAVFKANSKVSLDDLFAQINDGAKELNIIVKADVNGSAEAVKSSLEKLSNDEVKVRVIHTAVGGITEGDVMLAAASNAIIIGFHVRPDKKAIDSAERQSVEIRTYRIIYECIEEIEAAMKGMLAPVYKEEILGHAEVRQTIHVPRVGTIAGSYVQDGKITRSAGIRVLRDGVIIFEDKISSLKRFKDDVKEVQQGYECGIGLERFNDIKEQDILEAYEMVEVQK